MYTLRPWTIRQYGGFSTAEETNKFFKNNLKRGQKGLSVAFDLPTHRGYDSDHPDVIADIGKTGVAIDTVEDMKLLFEDIPLDKVSVSMTMNGAILPIMAFYIVAAEEQGVSMQQLSGTIQNDILKEFMVRNTYIYPPIPSMNITTDIISYSTAHLPKFNPISISGYHIQEAGGSADIELAYTLCNGIEYIKHVLERGIDIDEFAPRLSFFWGIGMDHYKEIAKLRAARILWSNLIYTLFNPKSEKSMMLRAHSQTSGWSLTQQEPYNNISRTCIEAMSAILGHTQSLHTNSFDEAFALPSITSSRVARNTQLYLQKHTDITKAIDPYAGSYYIEKLTQDLIEEAIVLIKEIDANGGMVKAIELGIPQRRIEESATKRQAMIDSKKEVIVGVNKYVHKKKSSFDILEIDNKEVKDVQLRRLNLVKSQRDIGKVEQSLLDLSQAAESKSVKGSSKEQNLLSLAIEAARNRATVGEISSTLAKHFKYYKNTNRSINFVYSSYMETNKDFEQARRLANKFEEIDGRRPRILIAKMGQDGHDRGAKVVASGLADIGFDVDIGPLFQRPDQIANQGIENDVHIIGVSTLAGGHKTLVEMLLMLLQEQERLDIQIIVGGIVPPKDIKIMMQQGVMDVFTPGTPITKIALKMLKKLIQLYQS